MRNFLRACSLLAIVLVAGQKTFAFAQASPPLASDVLGVADWGGVGSDNQPDLVSGADDAQTLGVHNLKIAMGPNYQTLDYPGTNFGGPISSLTDLAKSAPFQTVLSKPFSTFDIDTVGINDGNYLNGFNPKQVYNEMYNFVDYLMKEYRNSGTTVLVQNWEGDNAFMEENSLPDHPSTQTEINNMIQWLNVRNQAIEDARKANARTSTVTVKDVVEINSVSCARQGISPCMLTDVLPYVRSDMISYSSYETINSASNADDMQSVVSNDLDYIRASDPLPLMIGEYGFTTTNSSAARAASLTQAASEAFINEGVPYAFDWEMLDDPGYAGYGLLDADGARTDSWRTIHNLVESPAGGRPQRQNHGTGISAEPGSIVTAPSANARTSTSVTVISSQNPGMYQPVTSRLQALKASTPTSLQDILKNSISGPHTGTLIRSPN